MDNDLERVIDERIIDTGTFRDELSVNILARDTSFVKSFLDTLDGELLKWNQVGVSREVLDELFILFN